MTQKDKNDLITELLHLDSLYALSRATKKNHDLLELGYRQKAFEIHQLLSFMRVTPPPMSSIIVSYKPLSIDLVIVTALNENRDRFVHIDELREAVRAVKTDIHQNTISARLNALKRDRCVIKGRRGYWKINPELEPDSREINEFI